MRPRCAPALALALAAIPSAAHAGDGMTAHRVPEGTDIALDGRIDEPFWRTVPEYAGFREHSPRDDRDARLPTTVQVAYDDEYLYIAVSGDDDEPERIRAPFARRDKTFGEQDLFQLFIDASGERKSAQFFRVNPRGAVSDGVYTEAGGEDFSPDFPFDAAARHGGDGWTAELRIPFSSLAYDASGRDWTLLVIRNMPRADRVRYANTTLPRDNNCMLCYSPVLRGLDDPPGGPSWMITPQLTASRRDGEGDDGSGLEASLDAKVRLNSQTVFDATLNPDFSQVETDMAVLSANTRFSVLLPEKRPFFLEGADLLVSPLNVMHTRSITDPAWGARATYRSDSASFTVLSARDDGGGVVILPGAYGNRIAAQDHGSLATIMRVNATRGAFSLGAVLTDRTLEDGRGYNRVLGPDAVWQIGDTTRLRGQLLFSATTAQPDAGDGSLSRGERSDGHALYLDANHVAGQWNLIGRFSDIGDDFRADNGFLTQAGVRTGDFELVRRFYHSGAWRETSPYVNLATVHDRDGGVVSRGARAGLYLAGPLGSGINLEWRPDERIAFAPGAELLARDYGRVAVDLAPNAWLNRIGAELEYGDQVDYENGRIGRGGLFSLFARWRPLDRLEIEHNYSRFWVDEPGGEGRRIYAETTYSWNSIWHFSTRDTLRLTWQRDSLERNVESYPRPVPASDGSEELSLVYAHTRGFGSTFYLGYSVGDDYPAQGRRQRELFVKASWTF